MPGGRWVFDIAGVGPDTRLCCWDILQVNRDSDTLTPVATISGLKPAPDHPKKYLSMQYDEIRECLNVAFAYSSFNQT